MARNFGEYLEKSADVLLSTRTSVSESDLQSAIDVVVAALVAGEPLLVCGNGGSAADAQHIVGELVGRFLVDRRPLNAICLNSNTSTLTAWANDVSYEDVFARQVEAHCARGGGALMCLSTSGNSPNVVKAAQAAQTLGVKVISLTGASGGALAQHSDVLLEAPSKSTPLIQQVHICLYHFICEAVEKAIVHTRT